MGSVEEAIQWLKYTYLWVRMVKNPLLYGINQKMRERDPDLHHVSQSSLSYILSELVS